MFLPVAPPSGSAATLLLLVILAAVAVGAGAIGSLLGLGGGLFLVPALVLLFGFDIHLAIAASLVGVVATSSGSATAYIEEGLTDLRLGMFLESATAIGGVLGALTAVTILARRSDILVFTFVPVVLVSAYFMFRARRTDVRADARRDRLAERLRLSGRYFDEPLGRAVDYRATRTGLGLALSGVAGVVSGLLGVGGGIVKVPAMNTVMNIPIRVATATSNFMIGVTAAAGAMVYLVSGEVALDVAAPAILGLLAGTVLGARWHRFASFAQLKVLFATLLVVEAVFLLLRATGVVG